MSTSHKRSSSFSNRARTKKNYIKYEEEKVNPKYEINQYYNNNNYNKNHQNGLMTFDDFFSNMMKFVNKEGYNITFSQTKIAHPDGRIEFKSDIGFSKNKPRTIVRTFKETKNEFRKDFKIINQTKSYKTGIIFKDTHYYETQKVIPNNYYVKFERTVTEYSDGTYNYGDWREIN